MAIQPGMRAATEVVLNPGDFHFHRPRSGLAQPALLRTLLGSCVSVVAWHPLSRLAGMSHSVLPSRCRRGGGAALDGRFCDEAIELFCQEIARAGAKPAQFRVYLVGGGQMYSTSQGSLAIGSRNIDAARQQLQRAGFMLGAEHVGMQDYRKVELLLATGEVTVIFRNKRIVLSAG